MRTTDIEFEFEGWYEAKAKSVRALQQDVLDEARPRDSLPAVLAQAVEQAGCRLAQQAN